MKTTLFLMSILLATTLTAQTPSHPKPINAPCILAIVNGKKAQSKDYYFSFANGDYFLTIGQSNYFEISTQVKDKTYIFKFDEDGSKKKPTNPMNITLKQVDIDKNIFKLVNSQLELYFEL